MHLPLLAGWLPIEQTRQLAAPATFQSVAGHIQINELRADESNGWIAALATGGNNLGSNALRPDATAAASPHHSVESAQTDPARQAWQRRLALY